MAERVAGLHNVIGRELMCDRPCCLESAGDHCLEPRRVVMASMIRLVFRPPAAHEKNDEADQQNQANTAATDGGAADIKTAAAEQEEKNKDE